MKKVLVSLLVLAVAVSGAFAAVNISGNLVTGYVLNFDEDGNFSSGVFGQDNLNSNSTKLTLGFGDDNGIWSIGLEGELYADGANLVDDHKGLNRVAGDVTIDIAKMISADTDWSAKLGVLANDRVVGLRAYTNKSGQSYDRVRSDERGLWANLTLGYTDLIQVQIGGQPALMATSADKIGPGTDGDLVISAMTKPLDGLAVSVDWALVGDKAEDSDTLAWNEDAYGVVGGAVDVNVGALVGLDFDLGVGFADRYYYGLEKNDLAVQVYGGVDVFSAYVEYALVGSDADKSKLHIGADINVIENLVLNAYFGSADIENFGDEFYVGGNVGYEVYGVTFQLNLQYVAGTYGFLGDVPQGGVKSAGFSITPMIKVNF